MAPTFFTRRDCVSDVKNSTFGVSYKWMDGELIEVHRLETPVGTITQHMGKDPTYGSNWRKKHYIESLEDYRVVQYAVENTVFRKHPEAVAQRKRDLGEDGVILSRLDRSPYQKLLIELARPERFLVDLFTDPGPVVELMEAMERRFCEEFPLVLDSEADVVWLPDNVTSDMTPPQAFEKYCMPLYEKIHRACREAGKILLVHMDGRVDALKELIGQAAFDVVDSLSFPEMNGDVPIEETAKLWPQKVVCPNFPSSFSKKPREEIESLLERTLGGFGKDKPTMLQISEDIPLDAYDHVLPVLTSYFNR
jgi:hypothetical protein